MIGAWPTSAAPPSANGQILESRGGAMTEEEAFKILAVEALADFGMTITVDDIVDVNSIGIVFHRIATWWNGLDQFMRDLIGGYDLTEGL